MIFYQLSRAARGSDLERQTLTTEKECGQVTTSSSSSSTTYLEQTCAYPYRSEFNKTTSSVLVRSHFCSRAACTLVVLHSDATFKRKGYYTLKSTYDIFEVKCYACRCLFLHKTHYEEMVQCQSLSRFIERAR